MQREVSYEEWINNASAYMIIYPMWESTYYRLAMYLYDLVWLDCASLRRDFRAREVGSQMIRSAGGICANIEEAYGRGVGTPVFLRIFRISPGEARETRGWYVRLRHYLPPNINERRLEITTQLIAVLTGVISSHRKKLFRD